MAVFQVSLLIYHKITIIDNSYIEILYETISLLKNPKGEVYIDHCYSYV